MVKLDLDSLLGSVHPEAGFHDARLEGATVRWDLGTAELRFQVVIRVVGGVPEYRPGILAITGLLFFAAEPPRAPRNEWAGRNLWISSDGPFPDSKVNVAMEVPSALPDGAFCHYFFSANTNSDLLVAGRNAEFRWV